MFHAFMEKMTFKVKVLENGGQEQTKNLKIRGRPYTMSSQNRQFLTPKKYFEQILSWLLFINY